MITIFTRSFLLIIATFILQTSFAQDKAQREQIIMSNYFKPIMQPAIGLEEKTSFYWLLKSAEVTNTVFAQLAYWYETGRNLPKNDYEKAFYWYMRSAEETGNSFAKYKLGQFYENGWYVSQDFQKAKDWYEQSADSDFAPALSKMGDIYSTINPFVSHKDNHLAVWFYNQSADKLDIDAQLKLSYFYNLSAFSLENRLKSIDNYLKYLNNPRKDKPSIFENKAELAQRKECMLSLNKKISVVFSSVFLCSTKNSIAERSQLLDIKPISQDAKSEIYAVSDLHKISDQLNGKRSYNFIFDGEKTQTPLATPTDIFIRSSSIVRFNYDDNDRLYSVTYLFPAIDYEPKEDFYLDLDIKPDDRMKVLEIRDQFMTYYGKPQVSQITDNTAIFRWLMADGAILQIYRQLPHTHSIVSYHNADLKNIKN